MPPLAATSLYATTILELVDELGAAGVTFELDRSASHLDLVWAPRRPTARGLEALAPWWPWLLAIALGRYTGHALATCDVCGEPSMLSLVNTSGTSRWAPSVGWPKCIITPRCIGRRVIREADRVGVPRRRPPGVPTLKRWLKLQQTQLGGQE